MLFFLKIIRKYREPDPLRPGKPVLVPLEEVYNRSDETALLIG
jgi:hypothetical protein